MTITASEKESVGIVGLHRLSLCDVRSPKARKLESDIVGFGRAQDALIDGRREAFHRAASRAFRSSRIRSRSAAARFWHDEARAAKDEIAALRQAKGDGMAALYQMLRDVSLVDERTVKNIIPTAGRSVIARWLMGDNTYNADDGADYGSLGTSNVTPANGDTQLGAETYRKARSSESRSSNVVTLFNFYTSSEVTGTFEEAGWHIDATGAANSGQLFSHFLTGTLVKTSVEALVQQSEFTIN